MTPSRWPVAFPASVPRMTGHNPQGGASWGNWWPGNRLDRLGFYRRNRPSYTLLQF